MTRRAPLRREPTPPAPDHHAEPRAPLVVAPPCGHDPDEGFWEFGELEGEVVYRVTCLRPECR